MDQETIIQSLGQNMDTLQGIFTWGLVLAFGVGWAGLQNKTELEVSGFKVRREAAFQIAAFVYFVANLTILLLLWRIQALLVALDDGHFLKGYTTLALHKWVLNPFAYVGTSDIASLSTQWSIGLLIASWWVCLTSIAVIRIRQNIFKLIAIPFLFYVAGCISLYGLYQIYDINLTRIQALDPLLYAGIRATASGRWIAIGLGTVGGCIFFVITLWYHRKRMKVARGSPKAA